MWQSVEILNDFESLKQIFWKTKLFFKKLEYCLLVKSTKFEYKTFPYKTALSESSVKVNRNGEYKMDLSQRTEFYQTNLFTWKFCFSLRASYKRVDLIKDVKELSLAKLSNILDLMYQLLKCPYTAWKVSKYGFFSGPYFLVLGLNMEIYIVNLRIQSQCRKKRTRKNSVFGHFSRSDIHTFRKHWSFIWPDAQLEGGRWEASPVLFWKSKKCPDFGKKIPWLCPSLG